MILFRIIPISNTFSRLLIISAFMHIAHAAEVVISGYYRVSPLFMYLAALTHTQPLYTYMFIHLIMYAFVIATAINSQTGKLPLYSLLIFGWLLVSETHHTFTALKTYAYHPGTITSILIIPLAIIFWIQLCTHTVASKK